MIDNELFSSQICELIFKINLILGKESNFSEYNPNLIDLETIQKLDNIKAILKTILLEFL